jgi:hypothetical protein
MNTERKKMKTLKIHLLITFMIFALGVTQKPLKAEIEDSIIKIRLSYKIIINPETGKRPKLQKYIRDVVTNQQIINAVNEMNELMASYWRGYRFELLEIVELKANENQKDNLKKWFELDFVSHPNRKQMGREFEALARKNPELYGWRQDAINIYINQGTSGGLWNTQNMIFLGPQIVDKGWMHLHEIGHFFYLVHTHGNFDFPSIGKKGPGHTEPGDDEINDTIWDFPTWDKNKIAKYNFSKKYQQLDENEKRLVDNVAHNIMSYHFKKQTESKLIQLTEGQLDRFTYALDHYIVRQGIRDGQTHFVSNERNSNLPTIENYYKTVQNAVLAANENGGDIILLAPGSYQETLIINKPVTLRATREGHAIIGDTTKVLASK